MSTLELKELSHPSGEVIKIASGKTLDLKTQGSVTMPTGSVINVYTVEKTDTQTTSAFTMVDISGLSITLTPSSATSKFLITLTIRASSNFYKSYINLLRDSTPLFNNADGAGDGRTRFTSTVVTNSADSNSDGIMHNHNLTILDAPTTTSAITYKCQFSGRNSAYVMHINKSNPDRAQTEYDSRTVSNMVIQEIQG